MAETRKLAAILAADVVGYSRLTSADEDRTLARLRALRSDLIDPTIVVHHGRVVKRTGDGALVEFRSVVDAVRCAIEVQNGMVERNAGLPPERRIEFRIGIHLGDVVEESDGDLMGDGIKLASGTDDATTLAVAAFVIAVLSKDYKAALSAIERALSLNPSSATALYWGALIHASSGNSAAATAYANRALRLSPFDPVAFAAHGALGHVAFQEARYDEAASCYAKAVQANPRFSLYYFVQAIALALAGRVEEARPIVGQGLELNPGARISEVLEYALPHPALADKFIEGARLLGLPE